MNVNKNYKNIIETKPIFFLFTCVKNGRKYIKRLFDSLIVQSQINFVHYIYEDGSTDPIEDLVEEYRQAVKKLDHPFTIIYEQNKKNIGLNLATKHCIDKCFLPYFIWIDCDNWVDRYFFENLEKGVYKNPNSIVYRTKKVVFDENLKKIVKEIHPYIQYKKIKYSNRSLLILLNSYYYSFFAINLEKFKEINPSFKMLNIPLFFNDQQILYSCSLSKYDFSYIPKSKGYYCRRQNSESLSSSIQYSEEILNHFNNLNYILKQDAIAKNQMNHILDYYQIKSNWSSEYGERNYLKCRKMIKEKRKAFKLLNVPNSFSSLNRISLLFCLAYLFPRTMSKIMKARK